MKGFPHPDFLLPLLTSRQLTEWMAYYNRNPFGQDVSDKVLAEIGAALWNQNRGKGVDPKRAEDFLLHRVEQQDTEQMKLALRRHLP